MRRDDVVGLLLALGLALVPSLVWAAGAQPVITLPEPRASTGGNASTTVASTNVFQSLWAANANRGSCTIENNSSDTIWVFFGPIASATKATSVQLAAGQSVNCDSAHVVSTDQVSITGTSGDTFFAQQQ